MRTRQTLLVLGETLDTRYAANFKAWRKPVDDVIRANATRNTQPNVRTYCIAQIFRRAMISPREKWEEKNGRERDFRDSTTATEGEEGGEMYVNSKFFEFPRGWRFLKIAYVKKKKKTLFFREIKIGNISNKFYFYSRSFPNGGGIKWRNWFGLNLFHRKLANDLNCATHLHGP